MNIENFKLITLFALGAMVVNSIGIYIMHKNSEWAEERKEHFMCFAAGMLISSALISAFPEALELSKFAGIPALFGFLFMYVVNKITHNLTDNEDRAFGYTALTGIGIHSLMDGVIYSVTFSISVTAGAIAGLGLVAHEFAEGVVTYSMLVKSGVDKKKAFKVAFAVAALTTPIGAFISIPLINSWNDTMTGLALGFVVGVLIYTSASHLLPEAENGHLKHSHFSLFLGVFVAIIMSLFGH